MRDFSSPYPGRACSRLNSSAPVSTPFQMFDALPPYSSASTVQSAWIRLPIDDGNRWMDGFSAHTATNSASSIAAILRASRCPSRSFSLAGPLNAHSIGTCWSSNIPMSRAVPSLLSSPSAALSPVMYSVPAMPLRLPG